MSKKSAPDYSLRLPSDKPFEASDDDRKVLEYVNRIKHDYYEADSFKKYRRRCEQIKYLVNQLWENGKKTTKFGFRLGMMRAAYDNYRDASHDLFDLDEWVYLTPMSHDPAQEQYVEQLEGFINNLLRQIGYKRMWYRRLDHLPDYGWSPAFADFEYGDGYQIRPNAQWQTEGGLPFNAAWATIKNKPVSRIIHPYAWFTPSAQQAYDFQGQGYIKRWYLCDVYAAERKTTKEGKPVYNPKAIKALKEKFSKAKPMERDMHMPESRGQDINDQDLRYDQGMKQPYVDVTFYHGSLGGCEGYYDDPGIYIFEGTKDTVLRMAEDPLGYQFDLITHAKTHAYRSSPFSRSFLDATREHQRMSDLLLNLSIENQVDAMHRFWWLNEEDVLDPNDLYNPRGLNTFLLAGRENARAPERIGDGRSGSLQDMQQIWDIIQHDNQLVGATEQEIGLGGPSQQGDSQTATEASILKSASGKKVRAMCKRISEEAMIPEIKYLSLQALLYFSPEQLRMTTKNGQPIQMSDAHIKAFLTNSEFRVNDHVTRDSDSEALKSYNFWMSALKLSQQLATPDVAIKIVRAYGKKLGIEELDDIVPAPIPPAIQTQGPGGPAQPGQPGAPGAAAPAMPGPSALGQLAPASPAPPQANFQQPQAGNFNVAVS